MLVENDTPPPPPPPPHHHHPLLPLLPDTLPSPGPNDTLSPSILALPSMPPPSTVKGKAKRNYAKGKGKLKPGMKCIIILKCFL